MYRQLPIFLTIIVILFAAVSSFGGRGKQAIASGGSGLQGHRLLNHLLDIGENPNEDIRTNVLLAMEGLWDFEAFVTTSTTTHAFDTKNWEKQMYLYYIDTKKCCFHVMQPKQFIYNRSS